MFSTKKIPYNRYLYFEYPYTVYPYTVCQKEPVYTWGNIEDKPLEVTNPEGPPSEETVLEFITLFRHSLYYNANEAP